jgi:hypothetical protein
MTYQGWDVQLTAYAARDWRANFFPVGIAHSIVGGSAWEPTPWRAVQRAAWEAVGRPAAVVLLSPPSTGPPAVASGVGPSGIWLERVVISSTRR